MVLIVLLLQLRGTETSLSPQPSCSFAELPASSLARPQVSVWDSSESFTSYVGCLSLAPQLLKDPPK